jgi:hypothetical protein
MVPLWRKADGFTSALSQYLQISFRKNRPNFHVKPPQAPTIAKPPINTGEFAAKILALLLHLDRYNRNRPTAKACHPERRVTRI